MNDELDEILGEFLIESIESLDQIDRLLVDLERDPSSKEIVTQIFRSVHSMKGTAGFLSFANLETLAHAAENLLARIRDGLLEVDQRTTSALLAAVDGLRLHLGSIQETGAESAEAHDPLRAELTELCALAAEVAGVAPPPTPAAMAAVTAERIAPPAAPAPPSEVVVHDSTIRVDVGILDSLMNLVGELVLARNQILQFTEVHHETAFLATSQQLNLITTELQEGVMKTRMQPIGNIWSKFPRVARDLAIACGKQVRVEMEGEETELDKTIIEAIKDPLTHIVRNSIDHGIECPEQRSSVDKPVEGILRLRAYHEGGQVIIEITDDGAGLDHQRIAAKAVERGLLTADAAARLSDREAANLILLPGFSTAEKVTSISGRGVGMDVVKTNIEKIGGTLDVQSVRGRGTTLRIKIPLTLAIIPALLVTSQGDRYAIPQVNLVELIHVEAEHVEEAIEDVGGAPVYRLRGRLLPLVYLHEVFGLEVAGAREAPHNIVVLQADDRQFGLVVDEIDDTAEIVVKPLGPHLKAVPAFAGTTIMGDGTVALILDAIGLAQQSGVLSELRRRARSGDGESITERRSSTQTLLVCTAGDTRVAVPIALVSRLEEFDPSIIERAGEHFVIQYRDGLLTLVSMRRYLDARQPVGFDDLEGPLQVLVHVRGDRTYGLVVDQIEDIVDADVESTEMPLGSEGRYAAVVGRRVTDLINIDLVLASADVLTTERTGVPR